MASKLEGCVALVTGASSGIGEATAKLLAQQGAKLVLVARREERLNQLANEIRDSGGEALVFVADITDSSQAQAAVKATIEHFSQLDILVNNAGVMIVNPVDEQTIEDWERMIDLNQKGLLYMTQAALPYLKQAAEHGQRRVSDIVNISSLAGRVSIPKFAVYNMTKFGVNGFSEALRQELAPLHVRVGVLEPGAVRTELNDHHVGAVKEAMDAVFASVEVLEAEDIADGIVYMTTRPRHVTIRELFIQPSEKS
ncbi:SDR family oxidoreductase [Vibrio mangrovi]|uniref:Putative oxidoreductase n=1 Tax=Vibrio mangrovi TaxID=474394 RepID=A0A1Y6INM8_9VIBR|nr:SDR family NAD(P)-dependent oxidoreductase [Vibrio mangrovi]MDW6003950.1 SDR family NAD(P)-dependent oxidoreductase [Vibrio mangrovi]SMR99256.1 putative oxidoreductase [Vibrio mangrovi]